MSPAGCTRVTAPAGGFREPPLSRFSVELSSTAQAPATHFAPAFPVHEPLSSLQVWLLRDDDDRDGLDYVRVNEIRSPAHA